VAGMIAIGDSTTNTGAAAVASPAKPSANSSARRWLALLGYAIVLCVGLQFILGWAAFATHSGREAASIGEALVRTAHQANGAALLGLTTALALLARQAWRAAGKPGRGHVSA
jgi:hypothetical protein